MLGIGEHLEGLAALHHPPFVHHQHLVADVAHHPQIVGHQHIAEPHGLLHLQQQVDDLGAHRDIQGGERLVGHDYLGVEDQRPRQRHPLLLAGGEHLRVEEGVICQHAHHAQGLYHLVAALLLGHLGVEAQRRLQDLADPDLAIEG